MPIRRAHEVSFNPPRRCPVCKTGITTSGRNQPVPVDEVGSPYCRTHGHMVAPEYDALFAEYERVRAARAQYLREAAAAGVEPTEEEILAIQREWQPA